MSEGFVPQIIYDASLSIWPKEVEVDPIKAGKVLSLVGFPDEDILLTKIILQNKFGFPAYVAHEAVTTREINLNILKINRKDRVAFLAHEAQHLYDLLYEPEIFKQSQKIKVALMVAGGVVGFSTSMLLAISEFVKSDGDYNLAAVSCLITPAFMLANIYLGWGLYEYAFSPMEKRANKTAKQIVKNHPELQDIVTFNKNNRLSK